MTVVLKGILEGLKQDILDNLLVSYEEMIIADIFSDFMDMAEYFIKKKYKIPSAVILGGVLEEHLRKLSVKNGLKIKEGKKFIQADTLNVNLRKNETYNLTQAKIVTSWLDISNNAAHANYDDFSNEQVKNMLDGMLDFLNKYPA